MASITENHIATGISHNIGATLSAVVERFAQYRKYQATREELQALTNRDLADLGMHRSLIDAVAREAVYGA